MVNSFFHSVHWAVECIKRMFCTTCFFNLCCVFQFPVIGQFLHLVYNVLNINAISQLELERMLLMPQASKTLATLMTSMLMLVTWCQHCFLILLDLISHSALWCASAGFSAENLMNSEACENKVNRQCTVVAYSCVCGLQIPAQGKEWRGGGVLL